MYKKCRHIHFIGIGGIGMSGIAEILKLQGYQVSGCDECQNSKILSHLKEIGCSIDHKHNPNHIEDADVLVCSSAIKKDHSEVTAALQKGIPVIPRAIMLAEIMRMKHAIAVSGTHGKTTTTSIISHILIEAGLDPTIIIGGVLKNISANAKLGGSDYLIAEADESDRSLLYLNPSIAVVTNIDADHLDTYKNLNDIKQTFKNFLARLPFYGKAILCIDDKNIRSILPLTHIRTIKYGFSCKADLIGKIIELKKASSIFDVYINTQSTLFKEIKQSINNYTLCKKKPESILKLGRINLNMPGKHNILNSLASIALSLEFDVPFEKIKNALKNFKGIERRFEFKGIYKGSDIFDDYGHHPTEIKNTLKIAQQRVKKNLHIIFQPHRFSRTKKLWKDFVETFAKNKKIKNLYLAEIYPASEAPIPGITSKKLGCAIMAKNPNINVLNFSNYDEIENKVKKILKPGDLLLTIGAGKVNLIGEKLSAKK
ncbi:UDP-N-acetylmuramate--L-alanine ligase [Candidatus Dependentiae bacterium]|nr:UDP-N-acetylmuramate--L-alanine ligase [Candidatus Dependentiae bacterium]